MSYQNILYRVESGVATISFNRPRALNAMTTGLMAEVNDAFDVAAAAPDIKVIVLTGEGRAFCTGADLDLTGGGLPKDAQGRPDLGAILDQYYTPLILKMRDLSKPIIAAVNGVAAGAGANLALMADLVIASRSSYFLQSFVNVGLIPDAGGTWILPRAIGRQRAMGLALFGEKLPAERAKEWGLIWDVTDDESLLPTVRSIAERLANGPGFAIERIKRSIHAAADHDLADQLNIERDFQRECGQSQDFMEGATAFIQKRQPNYRGF